MGSRKVCIGLCVFFLDKKVCASFSSSFNVEKEKRSMFGEVLKTMGSSKVFLVFLCVFSCGNVEES